MELLNEQDRHEFCKDTLELETGIRAAFMLMAGRLHEIKEKRLYEPFWSSWYEFTCEFKELSPATISKLIRTHEVFVLNYEIPPERLVEAGGWTKLYELTKKITTKVEAEEWLEKAKTLSRQDLKKELTISSSGVEMSECPHSDTYLVRICRECGERWEIHEEQPE